MILDGLFVVVSYAALHLGFKRGLVSAAIGFFGWFAALAFALKLVPWGAGVITSLVGFELQVNPLIAFVILFYLGIKIVQNLGNKGQSAVNGDDITIFNGLAGSGLYWVAFVLTMSILVRAADNYNMLPDHVKRTSRTYSQILTRYPDGAMKILTFVMPFLAEGWNHLDEAIGGINTSLQENLPDDSHHVTTSAPEDEAPAPQPADNQPATTEPTQQQPLQPLNFDEVPRAAPRKYRDAE